MKIEDSNNKIVAVAISCSSEQAAAQTTQPEG